MPTIDFETLNPATNPEYASFANQEPKARPEPPSRGGEHFDELPVKRMFGEFFRLADEHQRNLFFVWPKEEQFPDGPCLFLTRPGSSLKIADPVRNMGTLVSERFFAIVADIYDGPTGPGAFNSNVLQPLLQKADVVIVWDCRMRPGVETVLLNRFARRRGLETAPEGSQLSLNGILVIAAESEDSAEWWAYIREHSRGGFERWLHLGSQQSSCSPDEIAQDDEDEKIVAAWPCVIGNEQVRWELEKFAQTLLQRNRPIRNILTWMSLLESSWHPEKHLSPDHLRGMLYRTIHKNRGAVSLEQSREILLWSREHENRREVGHSCSECNTYCNPITEELIRKKIRDWSGPEEGAA